jgi:hypothetical protein
MPVLQLSSFKFNECLRTIKNLIFVACKLFTVEPYSLYRAKRKLCICGAVNVRISYDVALNVGHWLMTIQIHRYNLIFFTLCYAFLVLLSYAQYYIQGPFL